MRIVYFDTETTGVKPGKDHIIELALLVYDDGELTEEYDEFIQIDGKLPSKIVELTGITDEMLKDEGVAAKDAAAKIITVLKNDSVWVAHNTQFDLLFIYNLLKEYFDEEDILDKLSKVKWLDTLTIFKDRAGYPHRLENMVEHYKLKDVRLRNDIKEYVNLFGYNPKYGVSGEKFQFITYARQPYFNGLKSYRNILPKTIK